MTETILLVQPRVLPGRLEENFLHLCNCIEQARVQQATTILLPTAALSGSNLGDLNQQKDFQEDIAKYTQKLQAQAGKIRLVFSNDLACGAYRLRPKPVGITYAGKNILPIPGGSSVTDIQGNVVARAQFAVPDTLTLKFEQDKLISPVQIAPQPRGIEKIHKLLMLATSEFFQLTGIKKITVGLSGGIDSAVTAAFFTQLLGKENVLLLNLPGTYNSDTTQNLAAQTAANLGCKYAVLPITDGVNLTISQIASLGLPVSTLTLENIQARDRGSRLIAAAAAAFGGVFSANSNKAELTIGYATFYGDLAGAIAVLGDLWKHQVYDLGHYLNETVYRQEIIPEAVFKISPSAELNPQQTVGTGGDPIYYPYHDYLFKSFTEKHTPAELADWWKTKTLAQNLGCNNSVIEEYFQNNSQKFLNDLEHWWKAFHGLAVAKRLQAPPVIILSSSPFEKPEPQTTPYFSTKYMEIKKSLLK